MKNLNCKAFAIASLLIVVTGFNPVLAQQYLLEIDKPKFEDLYSPDINSNITKGDWKPKKWLEIDLKFKIAKASNREEQYADDVTVRWYVAANITEGGSTRVRVIEKEVKYVNVPIGEDVYVSVYLSPSAVKRISGSDNASKRTIEAVGGEIQVNGTQPVKGSGFFTTEATSKGKWWDELARYNKIPLRNKNETPFKFFWWDRYAEIEERR